MHPDTNRIEAVLGEVEALLDRDRPHDALECIARSGAHSLEIGNARGVALMRIGDAAEALNVFRQLCINAEGFCLRRDLPLVVRANYALALLMTNNIPGCLALLNEMEASTAPAVVQLRTAIARWRRSLSWLQRLRFTLYATQPDRPVVIDWRPGELLRSRRLRPAA